MVDKVGSANKAPFMIASLGAAVGTIGGAKLGLDTAKKYISKNVLPSDEFVKNRIEELTEIAKEKFSEEKFAEKIINLPKIAKMEYEIGIKKIKTNSRNAFAIVGGVLLASIGYIVSKSIIAKKQEPMLMSSAKETKGICGYDSTTAKHDGRRYSSTTA